MPWQECSKVDEWLRLVARLMEGEKMAALCRELDISRKTGYKIFNRYKGAGLEGLTDRSRRPYRQGCQLPFQIENLILQVKRDHPSWGAPKIREKIRRKHSDIRLPAISTVHAVLHRHGLVNVNRRRQRSHKAEGTALSRPVHPNELWCADYKGEFMLADRRYCYPLTITDAASRACCAVRHSRVPARAWLLRCLSASSRTSGSQPPFAPTTACPLPRRTPCSGSPSSQSGGCGSGSRSSASSPLIHSKTAATSECI